MKFILLLLCIFILICSLTQNDYIEHFDQDNTLKIVVTTYNPSVKVLERCLKSIKKQSYTNYDVMIVDDASKDDTENLHRLIRSYIYKNNNWDFIKSPFNKGPLYSRIDAIKHHNCRDNDIIILIDGDDELAHDNVFNIINNTYKHNDVWITFGNYRRRVGKELQESKIKCNTYNWNEIAELNTFRDVKFNPYRHLMTFKYFLYKKINHDHLKKNGQYFRSATDYAIMAPMLEMSGKRFKCINEVMYNYTYDHPESTHNDRYKKRTQNKNYNYLKKLNRYKPILDITT